MKRLSALLLTALLFIFSCSEDDNNDGGLLIVNGEEFHIHQLFGRAKVGSDYSFYDFILANDKMKFEDGEGIGRGINFVGIAFYREEASEQPVIGEFITHEIYEVQVQLGYDSETEDADFYIGYADNASVVISKDGSAYSVSGVFIIDEVEITFTYKGKLTTLPTIDEGLSKRVSVDKHRVTRFLSKK